MILVVFALIVRRVIPHGKSLNALMLGEDEAASLGIDPSGLILRLIIINTAMVAVDTAMVGVIAFIGLVVPHMLRMLGPSDYTFLIPASALLAGAFLMEVIDVIARLRDIAGRAADRHHHRGDRGAGVPAGSCSGSSAPAPSRF